MQFNPRDIAKMITEDPDIAAGPMMDDEMDEMDLDAPDLGPEPRPGPLDDAAEALAGTDEEMSLAPEPDMGGPRPSGEIDDVSADIIMAAGKFLEGQISQAEESGNPVDPKWSLLRAAFKSLVKHWKSTS